MCTVVQKLEKFLLKLVQSCNVSVPVTIPVCKSYGFMTLTQFIHTCGGGGPPGYGTPPGGGG